MSRLPAERKSANLLAFEHYLRTGERLTADEFVRRHQVKFNPYHDELGRFTWAPGNGPGGAGLASRPAAPSQPVAPRPTPKPAPQRPLTEDERRNMYRAGRGRRPAKPLPLSQQAIVPVDTYPEGKGSEWRSSNDQKFIAAADFYNYMHDFKPGMPGYRTPELLKAWAMVESGGNMNVFLTDPFQVGADWDEHKPKITQLVKGQRMTVAESAYAALEWLLYKQQDTNNAGRVTGYKTLEEGLIGYNGNVKPKWYVNGRPHKFWYGARVMDLYGKMKVK